MILRYVLTNFRRRKVRTLLMVLALLITTGLMIAMNASIETVRRANVNLIAGSEGHYDLLLTRRDTSGSPFFAIDEVQAAVLAADSRITAAYPRFHARVEMETGGKSALGMLVARDTARDDLGHVTVITGSYQLGGGRVALLETSAYALAIQPGEVIELRYTYPTRRQVGEETAPRTQRYLSGRFTVSAIVRQEGVAGGAQGEGVLMALEDAQQWLEVPGRAQTLVATVDPALYEGARADEASLQVRTVLNGVQARLGDDYDYRLDKAHALSDAAQGFLFVQVLMIMVGLLALGVVGLLIYTLVMTNVQEQRRDLAILRVLGSPQWYLFVLVVAEVLVIGALGALGGSAAGAAITSFIVVPLLESQMQAAGINTALVPEVSTSTMLPVLLGAFVMLLISSLRPAHAASRTKVMHAINPGIADNLQLADLDQLRERRPTLRLFLVGLLLVSVFALLMTAGAAEALGSMQLALVVLILLFTLAMLGIGLLFSVTTVPFERLILALLGLVAPRLTFFARRHVARAQTRNTLISLLVLFSGVLPSFLATLFAMEHANFAGNARQGLGAPVQIEVAGGANQNPSSSLLRPSFLEDAMAVGGVGQAVGLSTNYPTSASDAVGFLSQQVTAVGVAGNLEDVLFPDLVDWAGGDPAPFATLQEDPRAVIISEGLAQYLGVAPGATIRLTGEGPDHKMPMRVVGIARNLPGFSGIGRNPNATSGSTILLPLDSFQALRTPLDTPLPRRDDPSLARVLLALEPDAAVETMATEMIARWRQLHTIYIHFYEIELAASAEGRMGQQIFLLLLTTVSFAITSFNVFATIYISIQTRQMEIGMLKAVGMKRREISGLLMLEAITLTVGAALAGLVAGATVAYGIYVLDAFLFGLPRRFAVDTIVLPYIVLVVVLVSGLAAFLSAYTLIRKQVVALLRS